MLAEPNTSAADPQKAGPGLTINVNSNNPFLNPRTGSPALPPQTSPQSAPAQRQPNNPFLAAFEQDVNTKSPIIETSMEPQPSSNSPPTIADDAKELFKRLTVADAGADGQKILRKEIPVGRVPPPSERERDRDRARSHPRPNRSREEPQFRRGPNGLRIPVRPRDRQDGSRRSHSKERRRRQSSDTIDRPMSQGEIEAREKRRREREARFRERDTSRDSRSTDATVTAQRHSSRRRRQNVHVDVVDKLDVTGGLYGTSGMWHHDGPFDACRPHRNRKKDTLAPMGAFPTNSANQTIGGSGPVNDGTTLSNFHGVDMVEGFQDYSTSGLDQSKPFPALKTSVINPTNRVEPIHGEETMGLGTSTFLEGAPASRQAIQRTQSEYSSQMADGLSRKKSIAMRIRGLSQSKGRYHEPPASLIRSNTDKGRFQDRSTGVTLSEAPFKSPLSSPNPPPAGILRSSENNPFDGTTHDDAYEKKGASIKIAEAEIEKNGTSAVDPESPASLKRGVLERRATDNATSSPEQKTSGGFLSRVKSLKGPRRMKSERNPS